MSRNTPPSLTAIHAIHAEWRVLPGVCGVRVPAGDPGKTRGRRRRAEVAGRAHCARAIRTAPPRCYHTVHGLMHKVHDFRHVTHAGWGISPGGRGGGLCTYLSTIRSARGRTSAPGGRGSKKRPSHRRRCPPRRVACRRCPPARGSVVSGGSPFRRAGYLGTVAQTPEKGHTVHVGAGGVA